ncbi:MAG: TonB-dependent receptor, partial [Candidatus Acidoferrum typicum]|nr:TonB-dependent receptor [Candidatus Acidoferrum typicum]
MKRTFTHLLIAAILVLAVGNETLHAQATASGSIQGTITDKSKGVIEGSQVVVKNKATDLTRTTATSDTGSYRFELLPVGTYVVTVSKTGFTSIAETIEILIGQTTTVNVELQPGTTSEVIEVTSEAPLVDQLKTDVSQNITPKEVEELPLLGRDVANL